MIREMVQIDEEICDGCGNCVPECHEGALQIIDGKARLVSDLLCDGLGACIGHCPQDAITIEKREAEPYSETKVLDGMIALGPNTIIAHLRHLKDHNETGYLREAFEYLRNREDLDFAVDDVIRAVHNSDDGGASCGCAGSQPQTFNQPEPPASVSAGPVPSALTHWPIQLHLINPQAGNFQGADLLVAADCVAFTMGDFHRQHLVGKSLIIACPKLDQGQDIYLQKIIVLIDLARVNTITVMIMQVPCCGGLIQIVQQATQQAQRKVPVKMIVVSVQGDILHEDWI